MTMYLMQNGSKKAKVLLQPKGALVPSRHFAFQMRVMAKGVLRHNDT